MQSPILSISPLYALRTSNPAAILKKVTSSPESPASPSFNRMFCRLVLLLSLASLGHANAPWQAVDQILHEAVEKHVFPGAVALVANEDGVLYETAVGSLTYGQNTPLGQPNSVLSAPRSIFDMASCTKVLATTSAISLLFQSNYFGEKGLQTKVSSILGTEYNENGKSEITIENCLLHNAGFPPGKYRRLPLGYRPLVISSF